MPNTKSAKKRLRQSEARRVRSKAVRTRLKTVVKKVRSASSADEATTHFQEAVQLLDRAATRGLIHSNRAARTKARLAHHVQQMGGAV